MRERQGGGRLTITRMEFSGTDLLGQGAIKENKNS